MKGWQKTSFVDYPDKISTVFFFGGCNFRCAFCHNPDLVLNSTSLPDINDEEALSYLESKKHLYEGVCISGGEPTLYPKLEPILKKIRALDLPIKLDTNGTQPEKVKRWVEQGLVQYIAMDIKTSPQKYMKVFPTGSNAPAVNKDVLWKKIETTIEFLKTGAVPYEFRSTVYPPFFSSDDLPAIKELVRGAPAYYLQAFNPKVTLGNDQDTSPLPESELERIRDYFADAVGKCEIR